MVSTTTWSDLPVEIICEVIKHLDFKSRMKLRATARFEKEVVEATKMSFHHVEVDGSCFQRGPHVSAGREYGTREEEFGGFEGEEKLIALMTSLMRYTKITQFILTAYHPHRKFLDGSIEFLERVTERGGKFKYPVFNINHFDDNDFQRAFELCDPGIEAICLIRPPKLGFERVFRDPLTLPVVLGASIIEIADYDNSINFVNVIMECWIKNDQIIGKKVIVWIRLDDDEDEEQYEEDEQPEEEVMLAGFKRNFEERVVKETPKSVRIQMDSMDKHILMRIHHEKDVIGLVETDSTRVLGLWEVISADLTEDRYSKNSGYVDVE